MYTRLDIITVTQIRRGDDALATLAAMGLTQVEVEVEVDVGAYV